jgi:hypothetical protein
MRNAGGTLVKSGSGTIGDVDELRIVTGSLNDVITVGIQVAARLGDHVLDGGVAAVPLGSAKSKFDALASAFEALWDVLGLNNDPITTTSISEATAMMSSLEGMGPTS